MGFVSFVDRWGQGSRRLTATTKLYLDPLRLRVSTRDSPGRSAFNVRALPRLVRSLKGCMVSTSRYERVGRRDDRLSTQLRTPDKLREALTGN